MARSYVDKYGNTRYQLNPAERSAKYYNELKSGKDLYTKKKLTKRQIAFRSGYQTARADNAKAFNSNFAKGKIFKTKIKGKKGFFHIIFEN